VKVPVRQEVAKHWRGDLALVFVAILLGILPFEVGLRLAGISYPSFYTWDEYEGIALRPGTEGWYRGEGESYIRINSAGLRDRELGGSSGVSVISDFSGGLVNYGRAQRS
jgi:hypothetical protein